MHFGVAILYDKIISRLLETVTVLDLLMMLQNDHIGGIQFNSITDGNTIFQKGVTATI